MGVTCGPGFPFQVLAYPALNPSRAVGFPLQSLTRADAPFGYHKQQINYQKVQMMVIYFK
jgi:hypothetical protein